MGSGSAKHVALREYLEGASTVLTNELYDIIDGRE
jgi:hypothetical protein